MTVAGDIERGASARSRGRRRARAIARAPLQWLADHPVLFRAGPTIWTGFGLFVAIAVVGGGMFAGARLLAAGWSTPRTLLVMLGFVAAATVGARAVWLAVYAPAPRRTSMRRVGFVSWGAYLGVIAFACGLAALDGLSLAWLLDRVVPAGLLGSAIGRLGCVNYGCCYGRPARDGVRWRVPDSKVVRELGPAAAVPRVPTQALSSLHALAIVAVVLALEQRPLAPGVVAGVALILYAIGRLTIDALRDPSVQVRYRGWRLTAGQVHCLPLAALGGALLVIAAGGTAQAPVALPPPGTIAQLLPGVLGMALLAFVPTSLHIGRVGRW